MTLPMPDVSDIDGVSWPPVPRGPRATLMALSRTLEHTQWLGPDDIRREQFHQIGLLAAHFAQRSPLFAERLQRAGLAAADLATPEGFARLPPVTRRGLQDAGERLYCLDVPESHRPIYAAETSGSTGQRVEIRKTAVTNLIWMAMTLRGHDWSGRDLGGRNASILPHIEKVQEVGDWGPPFAHLYKTGPTLALPTVIGIDEQVRRLRAFMPDYLLLSPTNLAGVMDECRAAGGPLASLKGISTINETLKPGLRRAAEEYFGATVNDLYSSAEAGNIAMQCPDSDLYHVMAEGILLEVLDDAGRACKPGEIGRVVVTDLANYATPLIRYQISDYAEAAGPCPCGRGLPTIKRIMGRERHLAVRPGGSRFWPAVGDIPLHEAASILQVQYVQHAPDEIETRLVVAADVTPEQEEKMRRMIQKVLDTPYKVRFTYFREKFPREKSGKFEEFVCKIPT